MLEQRQLSVLSLRAFATMLTMVKMKKLGDSIHLNAASKYINRVQVSMPPDCMSLSGGRGNY